MQILVETVWFTRTLTASPTMWHRQWHAHEPPMATAMFRQLLRWSHPLLEKQWNRPAVEAINPAAMLPLLLPQFLASLMVAAMVASLVRQPAP
jgi:hypothetical protein